MGRRSRRVRPGAGAGGAGQHRAGPAAGWPAGADAVGARRAGHRGGRVQRGQLPGLRARVQLDDHGRVVGPGPGVLPGRRHPRRASTRREIVIPPRIPADAARVVLIGAPGSLRSAVTRRLRTRTALLVCLDEPGHLPHVLAPDSGARSPGLAGATVVFLTVPGPPGLRRRPSAQATGFEEAALTARSRGAARVL